MIRVTNSSGLAQNSPYFNTENPASQESLHTLGQSEAVSYYNPDDTDKAYWFNSCIILNLKRLPYLVKKTAVRNHF